MVKDSINCLNGGDRSKRTQVEYKAKLNAFFKWLKKKSSSALILKQKNELAKYVN